MSVQNHMGMQIVTWELEEGKKLKVDFSFARSRRGEQGLLYLLVRSAGGFVVETITRERCLDRMFSPSPWVQFTEPKKGEFRTYDQSFVIDLESVGPHVNRFDVLARNPEGPVYFFGTIIRKDGWWEYFLSQGPKEIYDTRAFTSEQIPMEQIKALTE